jgi:hypothetical protein
MSQQAPLRNPFMLMTNPEVVLAAIEKSERLGQLNRRFYRPLDGPAPGNETSAEADDDQDGSSVEPD